MNIIPADDFITGLICLAIAIFFIALLVVAKKDKDD
jgi:hypothetical protein